MKAKYLLSSAFLIATLASCGKETVIKEVLVTNPPVETTAAPEMTKYDLYLEGLYSNSAQARAWLESDLLEFGEVVCDAFDASSSLSSVLDVMSQYSTGPYDDDLFAAVVSMAVAYLCPEHMAYVQSQI